MKAAHHFGLTKSFGAAIGAIALVILLSGGIIFATLAQLREATAAREREAIVLRTLNLFEIALLNQETGLRGYLLTGRPGSLEPYDIGRPALDQVIASLKTMLHPGSKQAELFAEAEAAARAWQANVGEPAVRLMANPANRAQAVDLESQGEGKTRFDTFRARLKSIDDLQVAELRREGEVVARTSRNAGIALWSGMVLALAMCGAVAVAVSRMIVRPLIGLAEIMGRLAHRDLTVVVPNIRRRNEIGGMARAVQVFKDGLVELDRTSLLRATADTLPALVGYVDKERRVGFLNSEFARWFNFGVADVAEVYGRQLTDVFGPTGFPGARHELDAAFAGEDCRFEYRFNREGLGRRALEASYRPYRGADGRVLGVVTLLTDITERKKMEIRLAQHARDLKRSNEELEQFAYIASHDLKAPLRGIENLVSWIEEDLEGALTGDVGTNMELLKSRVRRLESLLDDLLAYSRAGRSDLAADLVDTRALVAELAVLVSPPEGFTVEGAPDLPTLAAARAPPHAGAAEPDRQRHQASPAAGDRSRLRGGAAGGRRGRVHRHGRRSRHSSPVSRPRLRHVPNAPAA